MRVDPPCWRQARLVSLAGHAAPNGQSACGRPRGERSCRPLRVGVPRAFAILSCIWAATHHSIYPSNDHSTGRIAMHIPNALFSATIRRPFARTPLAAVCRSVGLADCSLWGFNRSDHPQLWTASAVGVQRRAGAGRGAGVATPRGAPSPSADRRQARGRKPCQARGHSSSVFSDL